MPCLAERPACRPIALRGAGVALIGGLPSATGAFLASLVECVEALTVVLAVGTMRGWRSTLWGAAAALGTLACVVAILGPALLAAPTHALQLVIGILLLLFGLRWLRKAILRQAGVIALHDETAAYAKAMARYAGAPPATRRDPVAFAAAFQIVMLEGVEVVFIVISMGAASRTLPQAASGAALALALVVAAGFALHRPLAAIPENALKFAVGVLLCSFGTFWTGEAVGAAWPGGDSSLPALIVFWGAASWAGIRAASRGISS